MRSGATIFALVVLLALAACATAQTRAGTASSATHPTPAASDSQPSVVTAIWPLARIHFPDGHCAPNPHVACGDAAAASWTSPTRAQLAHTTEPSGTPIVAGLPPIVGVATTVGRACVWTRDGEVWCWGRYGWMGNDALLLPGAVRVVDFGVGTPADLDVPIRGLALRGDSTCALVAPSQSGPAAGAWCWKASPPDVAGVAELQLPGDFSALVAGGGFACVLDARGEVSCWGTYGVTDFAQFGGTRTIVDCDERADSVPRPNGVEQMPLDSPVRALVARGGTACAVTDDGSVWCWGGESGPCTFAARGPIRVPGLESTVALSVGRVLCALDTLGDVRCAEESASAAVFHAPERIALRDRARSVDVGEDDACATLVDGSEACWDYQPRARAIPK